MKPSAGDPSMNVALNGVHITDPTLASELGVEVGTRVPWAVATASVGQHLRSESCS